MSCLGNIIWLICGGLLASIGYFIAGFIWCITIIGIPFGLQTFKLGVANLAPFGKEVVVTERATSPLVLIIDIIWLFLFGWEIALVHLVSATLLFITIIGIPFAKQHWKLIPVALLPFGRELREPIRYNTPQTASQLAA